jgi:hypothetical protein
MPEVPFQTPKLRFQMPELTLQMPELPFQMAELGFQTPELCWFSVKRQNSVFKHFTSLSEKTRKYNHLLMSKYKRWLFSSIILRP